jgi:hypothetical protein
MARLSLNAKVRGVLLSQWDPIGVRDVPQAADEYDGYAAHVANMLAEGTTVGELSSYLLEIEQDALGLRGDSARANEVANKLLNLTSPA